MGVESFYKLFTLVVLIRRSPVIIDTLIVCFHLRNPISFIATVRQQGNRPSCFHAFRTAVWFVSVKSPVTFNSQALTFVESDSPWRMLCIRCKKNQFLNAFGL